MMKKKLFILKLNEFRLNFLKKNSKKYYNKSKIKKNFIKFAHNRGTYKLVNLKHNLKFLFANYN